MPLNLTLCTADDPVMSMSICLLVGTLSGTAAGIFLGTVTGNHAPYIAMGTAIGSAIGTAIGAGLHHRLRDGVGVGNGGRPVQRRDLPRARSRRR